MHLFALLLLLLGVTQITAYSEPGGYERMLFYYAYTMDVQLNGGNPQYIARKCRGVRGGPCNLDEFLRYIAGTSVNLPPRPALPNQVFGSFPDMDSTAALLANDVDGRNFAGPIQPGVALENFSGKYDKFLKTMCNLVLLKLGPSALEVDSLQDKVPLLKHNVQAIVNTRIQASCDTFIADYEEVKDKPTIRLATKSAPKYDGAPANQVVRHPDVEATLANNGIGRKEQGIFAERWKSNSKGGHLDNVKALRASLLQFKIHEECT